MAIKLKHMKNSNIVRMLCLGIVLLGSGCSSIKHNGAPEVSFNYRDDFSKLEASLKDDIAIDRIYANGPVTEEKRNRFIAGRMVIMNYHYLQFVRELNAGNQLVDTAGDILSLSLNIAGTAFSPVETKTVLAAVAAGVTGSKNIIDKSYYFEKTVPILVSAMNAERRKQLAAIIRKMKLGVQDYPLEEAISDLDEYYNAGTLIGAINSLQNAAVNSNRDAENSLREANEARLRGAGR
jgi:hypothetical protein